MVLQIQLLVLESWMLDASYWMLEVGSPVGAEANVYQLEEVKLMGNPIGTWAGTSRLVHLDWYI